MKLAKALKLKNRLAGEIARLKTIIQAHNVIEAGQEVVYDVKTIAKATLPETVNQLVAVKTAIAVANAGVVKNVTIDILRCTPYWSIFLMAELKGVVESLRGLNAKNGKFSEFRIGSDTQVPVEYVASLKQQEIDAMVGSIEKQLDELQDGLDGYNAGAELTVLDGEQGAPKKQGASDDKP